MWVVVCVLFFLLCFTLPETNSSPLKIDPWKRRFLLETIIFRGYVSFRAVYCCGSTLIYSFQSFSILFASLFGRMFLVVLFGLHR